MTISILIIASVVSIAGTDSTVLTDSIALAVVALGTAHLVTATAFMAVGSITSILLIASAVEDLVVVSQAAVLVAVLSVEVATIAHHLGVITIIITQ